MTTTFTPFRIETAFWLTLCGGLAVAIGMETEWGTQWQHPWTVPQLPAASARLPALSEPYRLPEVDHFLDTSVRPLFFVTRRPAPAAPPPEPPKPTMKRDQFTLTGITVLPEGKFAFLTEKTGNKSRIVQEGKEINGITVKEIRNDQVVLGQYDETEVLMLKTAKGPAATIQPAPEKEASGGVSAAGAAASQPAYPAEAPPSANAGNEAGHAGTRPPRGQGRAQLPVVQQPPAGPQ